MTTGIGPYQVPGAVDTDPSGTVLETTIVTSKQAVDIGGGVTANAEVYNGAIPGPTLRLNAGDTAIVRLVNNLPHPTGIHWHGIELQNSADGTPVTQNSVAPSGGTYLYKFKTPRPGLFWYHPHHHHSTNRAFRGLYGMIVVTDPNEAALIASGVLPAAADTYQVVLSDITVCKAVGSNDSATYDPSLPFLASTNVQPGPTPEDLCELEPLDEEGHHAHHPFGAGDIPNIQRHSPGRTNEGQTVLTNGVNVGGRAGTPSSPGALAAGAQTLNVQAGQGIRLQIANCATARYFRLLLTTSTGAQVPLVRVGGEGGLLDDAVVEGGVIGGFDTKYGSGEILLPAGSRADVVAAIPASATGVLTLWTQDHQRTGQGFSIIPTVPVMHLNVSGSTAPYTISAGTPLRSAIPGQAVETLSGPFDTLLNPTTFTPAKPGMSNHEIRITLTGGMLGIDGVHGGTGDHGSEPYNLKPHFGSARYGKTGDVIELAVTNTSSAHHPFHLHGFSFQPVSLTRTGFPTYTWPYREFRDNVDIPGGYTLTFRVRLDERELADGMTLGGALGRWLFHCHIFFHAHMGMVSEFVTTAEDGSEKPTIDVRGSWAYAPAGGTATRTGTYLHPDGDPVSLTASLGTVTDIGGGNWAWSFTGSTPMIQYVYITATDSSGRKDQTVFRLKIGAPDDGADNGDPHIHTVDGKRYDFQTAGEFVLLRDREGMEIQTRHTPVATTKPLTDSYSGLTSCVSVNTAVAARVGSHRIAFQPDPDDGKLTFYLDGVATEIPAEGIDLDSHYVSAFNAGGATGLRVDYAHHAVLTVAPWFWTNYGIWAQNVNVWHTQGDEGLMGPVPQGTWLPALSSGATVGPMPASLRERYVTLYRTFANSWRVTDETSLFVYAPGTSTATFTDESWPVEGSPCVLGPQFAAPATAVPEGIGAESALQMCQGISDPGLRLDCIFDVATTGDEGFAQAYLQSQDLQDHGVAVKVAANQPYPGPEDPPGVVATVIPLKSGRPTPRGSVSFLVDGRRAGPPVALDERGRALLSTGSMKAGERAIQASYVSVGTAAAGHPSASPVLRHTVEQHEKSRLPIWVKVGLGLAAIAALREIARRHRNQIDEPARRG